MKLARLTEKLGNLLSSDRRRQRRKRDKLKELLKQMKAQQRALEAEIAVEPEGERRASLDLKLQILIEQRRKGVRLRKSLRDEG
jgi:hypothetical protein